ncbi:MAG: hypothetical protein PHF33_01835 [Candidatus Delongbacteria bacterium]|jgi:hypothetical protein|nr:hypothetical protein [Candidatus Delongbacteria bacterium]MDD4204851.1 hypothetical protein [Candidatus Delongbacteria bacterium]MDY0016850.1 hypothetical protein [Candidatus Delongbacteria bacterium]
MDVLISRLKKLDRRWIFLLIFLSCIIPFWIPSLFRQEFSTSKETQRVYDIINSLNEGDAIFIDWAFNPTLQAELLPMAEQAIKQCFDKKIRVFIYYPDLTAISLGENLVEKIKKEPRYTEIESGVDYIHLGYLPIGVDMMMFSMYSDFKSTFGKEGKIFKGIKTFDDIKYMMSFAGSAHPEYYILLQRRFGFKMGVGVTAVTGPDFIPYLQTGQLDGMLFGLKGAAEYENLRLKNLNLSTEELNEEKKFNQQANAGMASLTLSHIIMFIFIGIGNLIYFYERKFKKSN